MVKPRHSIAIAARLCAILLLPTLLTAAAACELAWWWTASASPGAADPQLGPGLAWTRLWLAPAVLAMLGAAACLGSSLAGVLLVTAGGRQGCRSRGALVASFDRIRRILPSALAVQTIGLASSVLGSAAFGLGAFWFLPDLDDAAAKLALAGVLAAALTLWAAARTLRQLRRITHLFQPRPMPLSAFAVTEQDAPGLFEALQGLVAEQRSLMPDHVAVGVTDSFFVTSFPCAPWTPGPAWRGRTLHLPLPILAVLDRTELRTVLAHELAHFSGEDTAYSLRFQPVYVGLSRSSAAIASRQRGLDRLLQPPAELAAYVLQQFDEAVKHWSRQRELEADRAAVVSGSATALATSLLRVGLAETLFRTVRSDIAEQPASTPHDFAAELIRRAGQFGFGDPAQHLGDHAPHPTDTHPPARQRIGAVGLSITPDLLARAQRPVAEADFALARGLFADWDGINQKLSGAVRQLATEGKQRRRDTLVKAAQAEPGEVSLRESRTRQLAGLSLLALMCAGLLFCGVVALRADGWSDPRADTAMAIVAVASSIGLAAVMAGMVRLWLRGREPYLVLTAEGIRSPGFVGVVPWLAMRSIQVVGRRSVVTSFNLADGAALPERTGRIMRLKLRRKQRSIQFSGLLPAGVKPAELHRLLLRSARAASARAELGSGGGCGLPDGARKDASA